MAAKLSAPLAMAQPKSAMVEVIYGKPRRQQYWLLTAAPETLPDNSASFVMVAALAIKLKEK